MGVTPYRRLYEEALSERGTFNVLEAHKVRKFIVLVFQKDRRNTP